MADDGGPWRTLRGFEPRVENPPDSRCGRAGSRSRTVPCASSGRLREPRPEAPGWRFQARRAHPGMERTGIPPIAPTIDRRRVQPAKRMTVLESRPSRPQSTVEASGRIVRLAYIRVPCRLKAAMRRATRRLRWISLMISYPAKATTRVTTMPVMVHPTVGQSIARLNDSRRVMSRFSGRFRWRVPESRPQADMGACRPKVS